MAGFQKAVRSQARVRAAIDGPSGSGKTFSALRLAFALKAAGMGSKVAVIDTENNSASLYAGEAPDGERWDFDVMNLSQYSPDKFTDAINAAVREKYDIVVVDSLTHAWQGAGGALDLVDQKGGNKFAGWKDVTPMHRKMVDTIIRSPAHVIVTMRSKMEHVMVKDDRGNVVEIKKVGMAPIQRDGMEYEFTIYGSMDWSHQIKISKSRCSGMQDATAVKPGPDFWAPLFDWLKSAAPSDPASFAESAPPPDVKKEPPEHSPEGKPAGWAYAGVLGDKINAAADLAALNAVGETVKTAVAQKHIKPADRDVLHKAFGKKRDELRAVIAKVDAAAEPPADPVATDDTKST